LSANRFKAGGDHSSGGDPMGGGLSRVGAKGPAWGGGGGDCFLYCFLKFRFSFGRGIRGPLRWGV